MTEENAPRGGRDVVDILTADHREVTDLLSQIVAESGLDRRRDLADTMIAELVRHSVAEEMHVYPAIREHVPDAEQAAEHDIEEHKELESLLKDLENSEPSSSQFAQTVAKLGEVLDDHVSDEEADQFPQLRAHVPADELVKIGAKVETAKKLAPTRPHPSAPNAKLFHMLAGPGVGMVDRLRDRLTGRSTE
jgi:hemerythrin superfamily protein